MLLFKLLLLCEAPVSTRRPSFLSPTQFQSRFPFPFPIPPLSTVAPESTLELL
jgi:hypothetical protein